jgi:hypothetical protein
VREYNWKHNYEEAQRDKTTCRNCASEINRLEKRTINKVIKKGKLNPMYGKSAKDIWIEKYGKEKAEVMWKLKYENMKRPGKGIPLREYLGEESYNKYYENRFSDAMNRPVDDYKTYNNKVRYWTEKQPLHTLPNYEKRGQTGLDESYHLDHIIPVTKGYEMGIDWMEIADIKNLQFIPAIDNIKKGNKIDE